MDVDELIGRCCRGDVDAWEKLWRLLWPAALARLQRRFPRYRRDPSRAENALQACFCHWVEHKLGVLKRFRGGTLEQLMSYLLTCAERYAVRRLGRSQVKEARARDAASVNALVRSAGRRRFRPRLTGLSEAEVQMFLRDLRDSMAETDRDALDEVSSCPQMEDAAAERGHSGRSMRRKRKDLLDRYGDKT